MSLSIWWSLKYLEIVDSVSLADSFATCNYVYIEQMLLVSLTCHLYKCTLCFIYFTKTTIYYIILFSMVLGEFIALLLLRTRKIAIFIIIIFSIVSIVNAIKN